MSFRIFNPISLVLGICLNLAFYANAKTLDSDDFVHPVAHVAGSYMVTHISHVACKKITPFSTLTCSLLGGLIATSGGLIFEMTQDQLDGNWKNGFLYNSSGVIFAIGIINLDF